MPANFSSGFFVREPAWHGLGVTLPDYLPLSTEEDVSSAIRLAGQDWTVERAPVKFGTPSATSPTGMAAHSTDAYTALYRSDRPTSDGLLAIMPTSYEVAQNPVLWDLARAFHLADSDVNVETAGVLEDGRKVWALCKVNGSKLLVPGDNSETDDYLFLLTSHDGSAALQARRTRVRVVCRNTWDAALGGGRSILKFRHTATIMQRVDAAKRALQTMREDREKEAARLNELAATVLSPAQVTWTMEQFVPLPAEPTDRQVKNAEDARAAVLAILHHGQTVPDAHRSTAYGVFQAGVEYLDWGRRARTDETRFSRIMLGDGSEKVRLANLTLAAVR